jgi:hypothetical protein
MKRILRSALCLAVFTASASVAVADSGIAVVAAIDFGFKSSDITFEEDGQPINLGQDPQYIAIIPSLAISSGRFYGVLSFDFPASQYTDSIGGTPAAPDYIESNYRRKETALTFGYRVLPSLSVFAGFLKNETTMLFKDYVFATPVWVVESFLDMTLDESGYHAGVNYTHAFGDVGTLSASVARGWMDGDLFISDGLNGGASTSADATGNSFSLTWTGPLTGSLSYRVGFRYVKYSFEFQTSNSITINEPVTAITLGIGNYF